MELDVDATRRRELSLNAAKAVQSNEHIIEIVSDSGEGAQTCGTIFGKVCARSGYGLWTVEIIPAEIEPHEN